jgi:hypothetical protein
MPNYRRAFVPGGSFFFTVVTNRLARLFAQPRARRLLGSMFRRCLLKWPFTITSVNPISMSNNPPVRAMSNWRQAQPAQLELCTVTFAGPIDINLSPGRTAWAGNRCLRHEPIASGTA